MVSRSQKFVERLLKAFKTPTLQAHRDEAERIRHKNSPRNIYSRWRSSQEGKQWKEKEYQRINGKCPGHSCGHIFPGIDYFTIDHIRPISKYPDLAIDTKNLQLLCDRCNRKKSDSLES
ncbi:MAG: HNH endonuclease [Thermosynechococcaceae cyanobacterium]